MTPAGRPLTARRGSGSLPQGPPATSAHQPPHLPTTRGSGLLRGAGPVGPRCHNFHRPGVNECAWMVAGGKRCAHQRWPQRTDAVVPNTATVTTLLSALCRTHSQRQCCGPPSRFPDAGACTDAPAQFQHRRKAVKSLVGRAWRHTVLSRLQRARSIFRHRHAVCSAHGRGGERRKGYRPGAPRLAVTRQLADAAATYRQLHCAGTAPAPQYTAVPTWSQHPSTELVLPWCLWGRHSHRLRSAAATTPGI